MTKKLTDGDYVRVVVEGRIIDTIDDEVCVKISNDMDDIWVRRESATKIVPEPKPGEVWKHSSGGRIFFWTNDEDDGNLWYVGSNGIASPWSSYLFKEQWTKVEEA